MRAADGEEPGLLLDEQAACYQAIATEHYDHYLDLPGGEELTAALEAFRPSGSVLELACGPGAWTSQLLRHAADITAVDASPEMLAIAATRAGSERVRFIRAGLFAWEPDRHYDVVFFGFWLSHVPRSLPLPDRSTGEREAEADLRPRAVAPMPQAGGPPATKGTAAPARRSPPSAHGKLRS